MPALALLVATLPSRAPLGATLRALAPFGAILPSLAPFVASAPAGALQGSTALDPGRVAERVELAHGLDLELAAAEPDVVRPVALAVDAHGRVLVLHGGGARGADRLTLATDGDGDGRCDAFEDLARDLGGASALALDARGAWVARGGDLLRLTDADGDGVPGERLELVLRLGAGALVRALAVGPDGRIYGTLARAAVERDAGAVADGVWRYDPATGRLESFAAGGAPLALAVDAAGELVAATALAPGLLHLARGARFADASADPGVDLVERLAPSPHTGASAGSAGLVLDDLAWPTGWQGDWIGLAADAETARVSRCAVERAGSSIRTRHAEDLARGPAAAWRPVALALGPDGALWIADAPAPGRGRLWRLAPRRTAPLPPLDGAPLDSAEIEPAELVLRLASPHGALATHARAALLVHPERGAAVPRLDAWLRDHPDPAVRLRALFALHAAGGLDQTRLEALLRHPDPAVRAGAVRLAADDPDLLAAVARRLPLVASLEVDARVRRALAAAASRLAPREALVLLDPLLGHAGDADDPQIPHLLWRAVEPLVASRKETLVYRLASGRAWLEPLATRVVLPRLVRRLAELGLERDLVLVARVLRSVPDPASAAQLLVALDDGLAGGVPRTGAPEELRRALAELFVGPASAGDAAALRLELGLRLGVEACHAEALALARDPATPLARRVELLERLARTPRREATTPLFELARDEREPAVRIAALAAIAPAADQSLARRLLRWWPRFAEPAAVRDAAFGLLARHAATALPLLEAVADGTVDRASLPAAVVRDLCRIETPAVRAALDRALPGARAARDGDEP